MIGGRNNWLSTAESARHDARRIGKTGPIEPIVPERGWTLPAVLLVGFGAALWLWVWPS